MLSLLACEGQTGLLLTSADLFHLLNFVKNDVDYSKEGIQFN